MFNMDVIVFQKKSDALLSKHAYLHMRIDLSSADMRAGEIDALLLLYLLRIVQSENPQTPLGQHKIKDVNYCIRVGCVVNLRRNA